MKKSASPTFQKRILFMDIYWDILRSFRQWMPLPFLLLQALLKKMALRTQEIMLVPAVTEHCVLPEVEMVPYDCGIINHARRWVWFLLSLRSVRMKRWEMMTMTTKQWGKQNKIMPWRRKRMKRNQRMRVIRKRRTPMMNSATTTKNQAVTINTPLPYQSPYPSALPMPNNNNIMSLSHVMEFILLTFIPFLRPHPNLHLLHHRCCYLI
mmetsp:Transcript_16500/g.28310  ORF Transcript_16500/g.28310 Transcript_16500/m.28310 type:complete len:209 (+) Transcript_16500:401-1027(+)